MEKCCNCGAVVEDDTLSIEGLCDPCLESMGAELSFLEFEQDDFYDILEDDIWLDDEY